MVYPDRSRQLAEGLRTTAGQLRNAGNRVAIALAPLGIDTPGFLEPVARGLEEIADEIDRRVTLLEQVDWELAGAFQSLATNLGFPGSLAPPKTFDLADPIGSSLAGLRPGTDVGPGRQPTQVVDADPVSPSTGNYLHEAIDLAQPARGIPTVFARTYNSLRAGLDGSLGFGWTQRASTLTASIRSFSTSPTGGRLRSNVSEASSSQTSSRRGSGLVFAEFFQNERDTGRKGIVVVDTKEAAG